jgi:hypothetical protein
MVANGDRQRSECGNFKELVALFSKRDINLRNFVEKDTDSNSVFCGTSFSKPIN